MTAIVRRLGALTNPTPNTFNTMYTVPAGKVAILRTVTFSHDGSAVDSLAGIVLNGAGYVWDQKIPNSNTSVTYGLGTRLQAGDTIQGHCGSAPSYIMLAGVELDAADAPQLVRIDMTNVTTTQSYTVPAGKRLRLRELVGCPHSTAAPGLNVFVGGIGYIVRKNVAANEALILNLDLTVNAGEGIGATQAGPGPFHLFMTGILEDA